MGLVGKTRNETGRPAQPALSTQPAQPAQPAPSTPPAQSLTRREFVGAALLLPAAFRFQGSDARMIGTVPLGAPEGAPARPLGRLLGAGLSARLSTDLSTLSAATPGTLVTPTDQFFVRTAAPASLPDAASWAIDIGGLVDSPARISVASIATQNMSSGRYLLECSGNSDPANYGLLSTADWEGVPLLPLLDRVRPSAKTSRVLASGVDDAADPGATSAPGASWIFSRDDLQRAIVAVGMNGAPLTRDHGSPVRLIVPGWYGCACIKWLNRIDLVAEESAPTTQMREFAARTHQKGQPALAREFEPAVIDTAAMPVRVEKWVAGGRIFYRVAGIIWGGLKPTNALSIRFRRTLPWVRVDDCPLPSSTDAWSMWTHTWRPAAPGRYSIVLRVDDPSIRTRRLDLFFYVREIEIEEI
jgi:DMSO/TMAO reductase YedYZ molybdopterin-dependent catalytic subunit